MIQTYLLFNGDCEAAFKTYQEAFGAELISMQKYGDMPPNENFPIKEEEKNLVLHSELKINDDIILGADSNWELERGTSMYLSITLNDEEKALKAWSILKDGGIVRMDLEPSFFAKLHGSLTDKFGTNWMFTVI